MAKGFASAREAFAEIEARKNSGGGGGFFFKLAKSGDEALVRIGVAEVDWAWVHELPKVDGQSYSKTEICRDQDPENGNRIGEACPGCEKDYKRKMQGKIPLVWRDGPVYEEVEVEPGKFRKNYEKVVGKADVAAFWTVGKMVLEELDGNASTFGELTNRDYKVTRDGVGLSTSYDVKPVTIDGETKKSPMTDKDKELLKELPEVDFTPPSYDQWGKGGSGKSSGSSAPSDPDRSPFAKKN